MPIKASILLTGLTVNYKTNGSGNGFDVLSVKYDAAGNVEKIYIFESKPLDGGTRIELPTTVTKGDQMGTQWIRSSYREMQQHPSDQAIRDMGFLLENNESLIERYVSTVDKKLRQPILIKLPTYP